jgi:hypothetical protein
VLGASHKRTNLPNQDAYACIPDSGEGENVAVAVADGHGSSRSFRSDRGAKLAVLIATRLLRSRLQDLTSVPPDRIHAQLRVLAKAIVELWVKQVREDLERHPFHEDDLAGLDDRARRELDSNQLLAYGATLLAAAVTRNGIYYLQVGDGDIMLVAQDGTAWLPLPPDRRLVGNETTSLCLPEAWRDFRVGTDTLEEAPRLILLSTDGYANSFQSEAAFRQVGADLLPMIEQHGLSFVDRSLEQWLRETTERGAGDDVTLAVASLALPAGNGRATAPPSSRPPAPAPAPALAWPDSVPTFHDRPPAGVVGREPAGGRAAAEPAISGYTRHEVPVPTPGRRWPEQRAERRDGQLFLALALLGIAMLVLVFLLLRSEKPATDTPSTGQPAQPTGTRQEPGRGWRAQTVFDDHEWAIEQSGAVVVRRAGFGGPWTSLAADAGVGWEAFLVENQTLFAVKDQGNVRHVLARGAPSVSPDKGTEPGGEVTRPAPPVRRTDEPATRR